MYCHQWVLLGNERKILVITYQPEKIKQSTNLPWARIASIIGQFGLEFHSNIARA